MFGPKIGKALEEQGFICYLPYRDTNQKGNNQEIFNQDMNGIKTSKIILAIALNETPNWGAEIAFAFSIQKPVIALTDKSHSIPLICEQMISKTIRVDDLEKTENYMDSLSGKIKDLLVIGKASR